MARIEVIVKSIRQRFSKKKNISVSQKQLSYEEVIKRYEDLSS
jgi:hypothetical protein